MELLCTQCSGIEPHLVASGKSHGFSRVVAGTWSIFSSYSGDGPSKLMFVQRRQDSCLVMRDTSEISSRLGRVIGTLLDLRLETQCPFPVATGILGFLSIIKRRQTLSSFEGLKCACISRCKMDVSPLLKIGRGTRAFSRVSTGYSDIPSPCEMKDEPAFKPLQGNPPFFQERASWGLFH